MRLIATAAFVLASCSMALAQSPGPVDYGSYSNSYSAPAWGQVGTSTWGTYSNGIGRSGWNYNRQLVPNEPTGSVLADPNQLNSSFDNPRTGAGLFQPQDTRLRGRDRP